MNITLQDPDTGLKTLNQDGSVPETRMESAQAVQDFAKHLRDNDEKRAWKRSRVEGIVGGNPPYKRSKMTDAGQKHKCNVNFGTARSYMESGSGAYYDLFSEAPGRVSIQTDYGTPEQRLTDSRTMSEEADLVLTQDPAWDFEMQQSQEQMVLHGRGPLLFEDNFSVLPKAVHDGELFVPDMTKADTTYWDACAIDMDYYPPDLYKFIRNEQAATTVGWNVAFVRRVIANAMKLTESANQSYNWEYYQRELKHNSLTYTDETKVIKLTHCFWREFDGRITHAIVEQSSSGAESTLADRNKGNKTEYLYFRRGRYASFQECVHPMYMDRGNGGFHHSVDGLGIKMYGAMEYENRLLCNLMDKTFAPKVLFRPTTPESKQKMELQHFGDYGVLPAGWDVQQVPIQGFLTDGLAMWRASSDLMRSNLSGYRQSVPMKETGNPATAREVSLRASEASSLSRPTYSRYYAQLDLLYTEIVRRLCNLNSTDPRAQEFQRRCLAKGVAKESFFRIESVRAVRVIGQGNPFMRQQAVSQVMAVIQRLPEDGQQNVVNDYIACIAGQSAIERYNPLRTAAKLPSDQHFEALQAVAMMKVGMPPIVTSTQKPEIYAATYLKAGSQALLSLQQGANPAEVYAFLQLCGPAIMAQLQRFANDPLRSQAYMLMFEQWKKLAELTDKLQSQLEGQMKAKQEQDALAAKTMTEEEIKQAKALNSMQIQKARLAMQKEKHEQQMAQDAARVRQDLALSDAQTASDIQRKNRESLAKEQAASVKESQEEPS